jgi:signal peptidase I
LILDLIIAGKRIRLQSEDDVNLRLDERFTAFIAASAGEPGLIIEVRSEKAIIPSDAVKVFDAQHMEETPEGPGRSGEPFWEVATGKDMTYIKASLKDPERYPLLIIPRGKMRWQLFIDEAGTDTDPLPYPLDGLILYFLTAINGEIMIHGSGVICNGRGWVFTGRSGSGKTTMAGIFDRNGDRVVHDDRLILMKDDGRWVMHSTPVYRNDEPRSSGVDHLWIISHGRSNISAPLSGAEAAGLIMANCIQQNWDGDATTRLVAAVADLASSVKISRLQFLPDSSIRDYLMARENTPVETATAAALSLLAEGKQVTITAGGYSMWPTIKPGDRIIITPLDPDKPLTAGKVVALRRDGGFVVHRITETRNGKLSRFIKTRGDAALIPDPWSIEMNVAGRVTEIIRGDKTLKIKRRRTPYIIASLTVLIVRMWQRIPHGKTTSAVK